MFWKSFINLTLFLLVVMLMTGVGWDGIRKEYVLNRFFLKKSFYKAFQCQLCRGTFVFMSEYSLFRLQLWGFASVGELV